MMSLMCCMLYLHICCMFKQDDIVCLDMILINFIYIRRAHVNAIGRQILFSSQLYIYIGNRGRLHMQLSRYMYLLKVRMQLLFIEKYLSNE